MLLIMLAFMFCLIAVKALLMSNQYADTDDAHADERLTQFWFVAIIMAVVAQLMCTYLFDGFFGTFIWLLMLLSSYVIIRLPLAKLLKFERTKRSTVL